MLPKKVERKKKSREQALSSLMRLCAGAEKCEADALRLMRGWGVTPEEAAEVLERLIRERFIDNSRYAAAFVRDKMLLSGWGVYKIRAALSAKGIARDIIEQAVQENAAPDMEERLRPLLERKAARTRHDTAQELKVKLIRYGLSQGYDYPTVTACVRQLIKEEESCEDFY